MVPAYLDIESPEACPNGRGHAWANVEGFRKRECRDIEKYLFGRAVREFASKDSKESEGRNRRVGVGENEQET